MTRAYDLALVAVKAAELRDALDAAARLRKIDTYATINERQDVDNAKLRAKLKVAYRVLWGCAYAGWECENCRRDCELHKMGIVKMPEGLKGEK